MSKVPGVDGPAVFEVRLETALTVRMAALFRGCSRILFMFFGHLGLLPLWRWPFSRDSALHESALILRHDEGNRVGRTPNGSAWLAIDS